MAYIVLARKYRPQTFDEVIGQEHITTTLKNAILQNRLAHAYLFAGPRGVGKTTCARILAKSLNCQKGPTVAPCQKCTLCQEITRGASLDVIEIDGASNRGIEEIRTLRENVKFSPARGKYKIYIIDEVHMLTPEAFNALLKTLEEPPSHVKFIFATTQPHKVLSTILSRCQRFDFRPIPALKIIDKLEKIAGLEKIEADKDALFAISKAARGSIRDAESILDQLNAFSEGKITLASAVSVLGLIEEDALFGMVDKFTDKDARGALRALDGLISQGKQPRQIILSLIEHTRYLLLVKVDKKLPDDLLDIPGEVKEKIAAQARFFSLPEILDIYEILVDTKEMMRKTEFSRIPLEMAIAKLTQGKSQIENKSKEDINPKEDINSPDKPKNSKNPNYELSLEKINNNWAHLIERLGKIKMSLATSLKKASPLELKGDLLTIGVAKEAKFYKELLERKDNTQLLEKLFSEILGEALRVEFIITQEDKAQKEQDEPFIQSALKAFKGRLIKG